MAVADATVAPTLVERLPQCEIRAGDDALASLAEEADVVVNGVVGFAGLPVTLATLEAGRRLALANKESLIAAGPVVQRARRTPGAELVPVDSEHGAIHQCLRANDFPSRVARLVLTASGGPFRGRTAADLASVTIDEALAHPTWSMGPKITVDSSTLMNKGLEVIEAHELFGAPPRAASASASTRSRSSCTRSRSSTRWSTTATASTIAQLSRPDMRLPIAYALAFPDRGAEAYGRIDWTALGSLDFEPPDLDAFGCLRSGLRGGSGRRHRAGVAERRQRGRRRGLPGRAGALGRHRPPPAPAFSINTTGHRPMISLR